MKSIPLARFRNTPVWRIIPSRFPPVDLFRDVAPAEHWDLIQNFEGRTNERLVEQAMSRGLVRPEDRTDKSSSHYILGPLTHPNPEGSRFSDENFGVLYAGLDFETAATEVKAHREVFLRNTLQKPQRLDMRAIVMNLDGELHDFRSAGMKRLIQTPDQARAVARELRGAGSYGFVFSSELRSGGQCVAIFRPIVLSNCRQERHFGYVWDGSTIVETYEYAQPASATR